MEQGLFAGQFDTNDQKVGMKSFVENGPGKADFS
jgi:enoyl-CoA hydratase